jgi:hypothetical protein
MVGIAAPGAPANVEQGVGDPERDERQNGPAEHDDDGVGGAEPERPAPHAQRQDVQHREADEGVNQHQCRDSDDRDDGEQAAGEAEGDGDA